MKIYIIILLIFLLLYFYLNNNYEHFTNNKFDFYVISMRNDDRLQNIKKQEKYIGVDINIFDAVKGSNLNIDEYLNNGTLSQSHYYFNNNIEHKKRELGCYLSHYNIYKKISANNNYTIIFEDDFEIKTDDFINKLNYIIDTLNKKQLEFDIIFLGNHNNNTNHGTLIVDNIYKIGNDEGLGGTQGYIINNKNINKILKHMSPIDYPIDVKIQQTANIKTLNVFSIYPYYVDQGTITSTIAI